MKKANVYTLDDDPMSAEYEDAKLLLFHSVVPSYSFVDDLNKLYNFELHRLTDMQLFDKSPRWPLYAYRDPFLHLRYYLTERPLGSPNAPLWAFNHKLLIIMGERADDMVNNIIADFNSPSKSIDPNDLNAIQHTQLLNNLRNDFTTLTLINNSPTPPTPLKGKALKEYKELNELIATIMDYIDLNYISDIEN